MDILGDLGGTHFRLALASTPDQVQRYAISDYAAVEDVFDDFLGRSKLADTKINTFYLASAVTPRDGIIKDTRFGNSPDGWHIKLADLQQKYAIGDIVVLNDLEAACYALEVPLEKQAELICGGTALRNHHKILVGVGTGIGHAFLIKPPAELSRPFVHKTHGGHIAAMAPGHQWLEWMDRWREAHMLNREAIWEDFVSGHGLKSIYRLFHNLDPSVDITPEKILDDPHVVQSYCEALGQYCHLLVGVTGMYGGLYLSGGVIDALWSAGRFHTDSFKRGFLRNMLPTVRADFESVGVFYAGSSVSAMNGLAVYRKLCT